jgi:hypothetical protein
MEGSHIEGDSLNQGAGTRVDGNPPPEDDEDQVRGKKRSRESEKKEAVGKDAEEIFDTDVDEKESSTVGIYPYNSSSLHHHRHEKDIVESAIPGVESAITGNKRKRRIVSDSDEAVTYVSNYEIVPSLFHSDHFQLANGKTKEGMEKRIASACKDSLLGRGNLSDVVVCVRY